MDSVEIKINLNYDECLYDSVEKDMNPSDYILAKTDIRLINPLECYDKDKILNSDKSLVGTTIEVEATFIITSKDESLLKIEEEYSSTNFSLIALKSSLVNIYISCLENPSLDKEISIVILE